MSKKKVKMTTSIASADWSYSPKDVVELDSNIADSWIKNGIAEAITKRETATAEPKEKATRKTPPNRKKG